MKLLFHLSAAIVFFISCSSSPGKKNSVNEMTGPYTTKKEKQLFFPVTAYIKGQLFDIKEKGVTPLKYTTIKNHTDSAWIQINDMPAAVKEFLYPEIDSNNLVSLFGEKRFLDQTINAFTFTYDPTGVLPDSMQLKHWDVYINPETNKVKRVFIKKEIEGKKTMLLTWQSDKYCMLITILNIPDGSTVIEKEEKIMWDF